MSRRKNNNQKMSFIDACDLVDNLGDFSDGTYWAMVEGMSGIPLCDGIDDLEAAGRLQSIEIPTCPKCNKSFKDNWAKEQHWQAKCGKSEQNRITQS